jgi:hypothetical protein
MDEIVFLVEEPSMEALLLELLPRIINQTKYTFRIIPHEGKGDLQKSIPRKLRAWQNPNAKFVILHDKDSHDCVNLKEKLMNLCPEYHKSRILIRIVCTELESWFLGDFEAIAVAFSKPNLVKRARKTKFNNPDTITNAAEELEKLLPGYQKLIGARKIAPHLELSQNRSSSFQTFLNGLQRLIR